MSEENHYKPFGVYSGFFVFYNSKQGGFNEKQNIF